MHPALLLTWLAFTVSAAPLLPDLVPWAKDGAYLQDVVIDTTEIPGKKLLRFSGAYANRGRGALEIWGEVDPVTGRTKAIQRVFNDDGTWTDYPAGEFEFHGHRSHNHFHFADFAEYRLLAWEPGDRLGPVLTVSDKVGYAMFDVDDYDLSLPGAPRRGVYANPGPEDEPGSQPQGISVGWADVYLRDLDEQWVDVTGLPDGVYWLEKTVDPQNLLQQSSAGNDRLWAKVTISGNSASATGEQPQTGPADPPAPPGPPPALASNGLGSARAFPNPFRPAQGHAAMTFAGLPPGASLKVYTLAGELVRELAASAAGTALWDGRNASGASAASGVYFVLAQSGGEDRTLKVAVQR